MSWYYYSGKVVRPVMIEKGRSVSVRPNTRVEILDESTIEFKSLKRRGFLRKTSKPKNFEVEKKEIPVKKVEDVVEKSKMAKVIAEKGITSTKDISPISKFNVELTEGEQEVASKLVDDKDLFSVGRDEKLPDIIVDDEKKYIKKKRR